MDCENVITVVDAAVAVLEIDLGLLKRKWTRVGHEIRGYRRTYCDGAVTPLRVGFVCDLLVETAPRRSRSDGPDGGGGGVVCNVGYPSTIISICIGRPAGNYE